MAAFDLTTFLKVQGVGGAGLFDALGMAYGLPSCMLSLASAAMSLLPSPILTSIQSSFAEGRAEANGYVGNLIKSVMSDTGVLAFDTETGTFKIKSDSSFLGIDNDSSQLLANLNGAISVLGTAYEFGIDIYSNYTNISAQIGGILDCLGKFSDMQSFQGGNAATQRNTLPPQEQEDFINSRYAGAIARIEATSNFINECTARMNEIDAILGERAADPNLEPCFLDSAEFDESLSGTTFTRCAPEDPGLGIEAAEDVFRLVYGPPITTEGQYILTSDGLYYDSQSGGLDPIYLAISGIVPVGDAWTYDYDPNLGGKGDAVSIKSLNKFTENIFDISRIDESLGMQANYNVDHFLSVLIQQKDKHVSDLSGALFNYIENYGEDSSIVQNQRQEIISEIANHYDKIDRRKKQIEIAFKGPQIYGPSGATTPFLPGHVPINDFSYLEEYNLQVDLEKQKALIFEQGEVTGMVLPINPLFVQSPPKPASIGFRHLHVPKVGKGSIIYNASAANSASILSLTDQIVTDQLFAIYNFLETKLVTPSSTDYFVTNCATTDQYNNAKLLGTNRPSVFPFGLAIPYFEGITKNKSTDTAGASAMGSFGRLPDTQEFRELTYSPSGFSIEFWAYVPNIMDGEAGWASSTASALTKVILGCENVGAASAASAPQDHVGNPLDLDFLENNKGSSYVRGMVMGFTRDRRITHASTGYSNDNLLNEPTSSLSFFIAPTQSRDFSSCSWINNDECQDYATFYKMKVDLSATAFGGVSSNFILVDITADPATNTMRFFVDGTLVTTSAISEVFGVAPFTTPSLPSFKKNNSFEYSSTTVDGPTTLHDGPRLNPFFTPWIVGGGYTDGMYEHGNFMGGDRGGIQSSYKGHLGSLKFYGKPLTGYEVQKNYNAQKGFFQSIDLKLHQLNYLTGAGFNVVLVFMDDLGIDQLSVYDSENPYELPSPSTPFSTLDDPTNGINIYPYTPTLSSIASEGLTFFNAHAQPLCSPSRAAIMTGKQAFSSPNYLHKDGSRGYWGHGIGGVGTLKFEKTSGGLNGLGTQYPIYDVNGNVRLLEDIVTATDGAKSSWASGVNFKILPEAIRAKGYKSGMVGKWHLGEWSSIASYNESPTTAGHPNRNASGAGWDHISKVGKWDDYRAMFWNLNKPPAPGHNDFISNTGAGAWDADYSLSDVNSGYVNYFMNKNGEVITVSDTGYTTFSESISGTTVAGGAVDTSLRVPYAQGDASSYATHKTIVEAVDSFNNLEEPFFLYMAMNAPHAPQTMTPSGTTYGWGMEGWGTSPAEAFYSSMHYQARIDALPTADVSPDQKNLADSSSTCFNVNAQIEDMDWMLSSFLSSIDEGRKDRTIFIFMGDNGADPSILAKMNTYVSSISGGEVGNTTSGMGPIYTKLLYGGNKHNTGTTYLPERRGGEGDSSRGFKDSVYERGTRVPLIVKAPFLADPGGSSLAFVDAIDIYATIAEIAGVNKDLIPNTPQQPQRYEGTSFLSVLSGEGKTAKNFSFAESFRPLGNSVASGTIPLHRLDPFDVDGVINDAGMGTYTGKVGKYTLGSDGSVTLTTTAAVGVSGNPNLPVQRRRGMSVSANGYAWGHHSASGADTTAIYTSLPDASAGTWKLIRCTSGYTYEGSGFDELYHLRDGTGSVADPFELINVLLPAKVGGVADSKDILRWLLDNADQTSSTNDNWVIARVYWAMITSLNNYLEQRTQPFS